MQRLLLSLAFAGAFCLPASADWRESVVRLDLPTGRLEVEVVPQSSRALGFERAGHEDRWITTDDVRDLIGRNYSIELRNRTRERLKVVVAIDGVNVYWKNEVEGRASDTGSILDPSGRRVLSGFQLDRHAAERFVFSPGNWSEGDDRRAIGTIEVHVYRERGDEPERDGAYDRDSSRQEPRSRSGESVVGTTGGDDFDSEVRRVRFDSRTSTPEARALLVYGRADHEGPGSGARLGIRVEEVRSGLRIVDVERHGLAAEVGLREGDVITRVDDKERATDRALRRVLERKRPGDSLFLELERGPHEISMRIRMPR